MVIVIKIGGSVLTPKRRGEYRLNTSLIRKIARILYGKNIVIVLGAGSIGHKITRKVLDYDNKKKMKLAFSYIDFERMVLDISWLLAKEKIPVFVLRCSSLFQSKINNIVLSKRLRQIMQGGFVPVLYGDVLVKRDCARIVSSDEIAAKIANFLHATKTIFLTDMDGLMDEHGKLIGNVSKVGLRKIMTWKIEDTSGGMSKKIREIEKIHGEVFILNGYHPKRLLEVLVGKRTICTRIR